jgi:hypothetical protein
MSLARLQGEFLERVLGPYEPADGRLALYHRSSRANRLGALAAAYPVVLRLVGDAFFGEAAARYHETAPSRCGDLGRYGEGFSEFLSGYPHARDLAYLADVARLEWAVHESRLAPEGEVFDYAALAAAAPDKLDELRIRLRPCVRLVASPYPVLAIWEANQEGRDGTPARQEGADRVVVRREPSLEARPVAVEAGPWAILAAFARGATLAQAAGECQREGADFAPSLAALVSLDVLGTFEAPA